MKKQILCALSVAALAATMLTVPVYAAEPTIIEVKGTEYNTDDGKWKAEPDITNLYAPGNGINLNRSMTEFDENKKPYVSYTFDVEKAGIYDLEYAANYMEDTSNSKTYLSPFSVSVNNDKVMFTGDTPKNGDMTAYKPLSNLGGGEYGQYNIPVYLDEGSNTITFTVEGGRYNGLYGDYVFYLNYFKFTYDEEATTSGIQVEAEELIAGNVHYGSKDGEIRKLGYNAASKGNYYQFNNTTHSDGYLEYIVPASEAGEYQLTLAGSNTDSYPAIKSYLGDYSIVINDDENSKIFVGSRDEESSDVTSDSQYLQGDIDYDIMHSNSPVTLKKGLNKVKVLLDKAAERGNHVIDLDYLKFTPVEEEPEPEPENVQTIKPFGSYDKETGTAEFAAEGLKLTDLSKLVFGFEKDGETTYKYWVPETTVTDEGGSANIAVRLTNIEGDPDDVRLAVSDSDQLK